MYRNVGVFSSLYSNRGIKMEKVKLTQEQVEALQNRLTFLKKSEIIRHHAVYSEPWNGIHECLNSINLDDMIRALYIGYEVEPEFKVGDWVTCSLFSGVYEITEDNQFLGIVQLDNNGGGIHESRLRHATPEEIAKEKERRMFATYDREPWEIKANDILLDKELNDYVSVNFGGMFSESKRKLYKVVCFAEDRKDLKE